MGITARSSRRMEGSSPAPLPQTEPEPPEPPTHHVCERGAGVAIQVEDADVEADGGRDGSLELQRHCLPLKGLARRLSGAG
eukprot:scaffold7805_cov116-Isochrysis_galbana.AAC.18